MESLELLNFFEISGDDLVEKVKNGEFKRVGNIHAIQRQKISGKIDLEFIDGEIWFHNCIIEQLSIIDMTARISFSQIDHLECNGNVLISIGPTSEEGKAIHVDNTRPLNFPKQRFNVEIKSVNILGGSFQTSNIEINNLNARGELDKLSLSNCLLDTLTVNNASGIIDILGGKIKNLSIGLKEKSKFSAKGIRNIDSIQTNLIEEGASCILLSCMFSNNQSNSIFFDGPGTKGIFLKHLNLREVRVMFSTSNVDLDYDNTLWSTNFNSYSTFHDDEPVALQTIFRALKIKSHEIHDNSQVSYFASLELEAYYKQLLNHLPKFRIRLIRLSAKIRPMKFKVYFPWLRLNMRRPFFRKTSTKILSFENFNKPFDFQVIPLALAYHSNRFGRNYLLPIWWIILSSVLLYEVILCILFNSIPTPHINEVFRELIFNGSFFQFLLPIHSTSIFNLDTVKGSISSTSISLIHLIDFVQRLVSGYLIFQFIRAFRFHIAR